MDTDDDDDAPLNAPPSSTGGAMVTILDDSPPPKNPATTDVKPVLLGSQHAAIAMTSIKPKPAQLNATPQQRTAYRKLIAESLMKHESVANMAFCTGGVVPEGVLPLDPDLTVDGIQKITMPVLTSCNEY